jgi:predicted RNA binding protein YcfA (HicA-like mRNA interferase family)
MKAGFNYRRTKGSYSRWVHPMLPNEPITIAANGEDDAKHYIEKHIEKQVPQKIFSAIAPSNFSEYPL